MEQAVLLMAGICLLLIGLSYFFRAEEWNRWLEHAEKRGAQASLVFGGVNLLIGSFIVAFHPVWSGIPLILTIIGLIAVLKSFTYLLFPQWLPQKIRYIRESEKRPLQCSGVVLAVIGILLLCEWGTQKNIRLEEVYDNLIQTESPTGI